MGNLGGNTKNVGNQGGDAGNQGRNLSIAVEMTWNSNGNVIFVLLLSVPLFRPSLFRVVFFSIFHFIGDVTLFLVTI